MLSWRMSVPAKNSSMRSSKKSVMIIPLNQINAFTLSACVLASSSFPPCMSHLPSQKLAHIFQLAADKAHLALSLIGHSHEVACAMAYVFGDTIVCADAQTANAVTIGVKVCSVKLVGDQHNPSGTLSGGVVPSGSGVLTRMQEVLKAERKAREAQDHLRVLERGEEAGTERWERWKALQRELEIKDHETKLVEDQIGGSNVMRVGTASSV